MIIGSGAFQWILLRNKSQVDLFSTKTNTLLPDCFPDHGPGGGRGQCHDPGLGCLDTDLSFPLDKTAGECDSQAIWFSGLAILVVPSG